MKYMIFILMAGFASVNAQHSISLSYQYPYTNDTYTLEYFYQKTEKWRFNAGVKILTARGKNYNNERAFYRSRHPNNFKEQLGVALGAGYKISPSDWGIKAWLTNNIHFTYAGTNTFTTEETGLEHSPGVKEVEIINKRFRAFPTIENHIMIRVEAPITDRLSVQAGVGYGLAFNWNWDPDLDFFRWTAIDKDPVPVGNRKVYIEGAPIWSIGAAWHF